MLRKETGDGVCKYGYISFVRGRRKGGKEQPDGALAEQSAYYEVNGAYLLDDIDENNNSTLSESPPFDIKDPLF